MDADQSERVNALRAHLIDNSSGTEDREKQNESSGSVLTFRYIDFSGANFSGCTFNLGRMFDEETGND